MRKIVFLIVVIIVIFGIYFLNGVFLPASDKFTEVIFTIEEGQGVNEIPEKNDEARNKAIQGVTELYNGFLDKFGNTDCKTLNKVDFRKGEEVSDWIIRRGWKETCDVFLNFAVRKCVSIAEEGII